MLYKERIYNDSVIDPIGWSIVMLLAINANSPRNTRDHLVWAAEIRDTMHEVCSSHTFYLAHGNSKGEILGRIIERE